ncbi:MAG: response regulator [Alphaproteobacteria bacterium]|nr:response regulator [Alphaproteobacteria bacterium]
MEYKAHILVVDDDARLRALLKEYLSEQGMFVVAAESAAEARKALAEIAFDLMVLDIMMPGESGLEFAASLRGKNSIPVLMLTAMGAAEDRIAGLETGVDDYLSKPFEPRELVLRIEAILRRRPMANAGSAVLAFGPFLYDPDSKRLSRHGETVYLTPGEEALLSKLAACEGATVTREALARIAGDGDNTRKVDVQITRLRRKIEADPKRPHYLQTVRGEGYVLRTK